MNNRIVVIIILGLSLLLAVAFLFYQQQSIFIKNTPQKLSTYRSEISDIKVTRLEIEQLIRRSGGAEAYQKLKQQGATESLGYQHDIAHIFGELLYQEEGFSGLPVCDNQLLNGCFHGFLLSAIGQQGLEAIFQINEYCNVDQDIRALGCHHGIGHGLGEYFGPDKLNQQLETCLGLSWKKPIGGCIGGVLMEYHFPSLLDDEAEIIGIRYFEIADAYDPCDRIGDRFTASCAYYIPRWWQNFISHQEIGKLCQGFSDDNQWYCYHGTGYISAHRTKFDVEETKQLCAKMPDKEAELLCRMSAAWSFETSPDEEDQLQWQELCQDLDGKEKFCIDNHDFDLVIQTLLDIE